MHRRHYVALFWAVAGAVISSLIILGVQAARGPDAVIIANVDTITRTIRGSDSIANAYMSEMVTELRRLRLGENVESIETFGIPLPSSNLPVLRPYPLPDIVEGWTSGDIGGFASYICPHSDTQAGAELTVEFELLNPSLLDRLTPIFFSIRRPETASRSLLIFEQQYEMLASNRIAFVAPHSPGTYAAEFGFYLENQLEAVYPRFFRAECRFTVA